MQILSMDPIELPLLKAGEEPIARGCDPALAPSAGSWVSTSNVRPYGLAFRARVELLTRLNLEGARMAEVHADPTSLEEWKAAAESGDAEDANDGKDDQEGDGEGARYQSYSRKKKYVKLEEEDLAVDWYDVLKLEQQDAATEEQVKTAYRRRCLETHPDKQKDHSDELFKRVQRAFDILGDPATRQSYDSSRPFDDSIPGEVVEEEAFYTTFSPVFERNKKWCSTPGMPSLGNDKTPYKDVLRFYERWMVFKSWRDFSHLADLDEIDDSMCREEKRYYMRENARQLAHFQKEELKRVRTLAERAKKNDPRLRRFREAEEAKRAKEVADREAFRLQIAGAEAKRRAEEEQRRQEKLQEEERQRQEEKNALRQAQRDVSEFLNTNGLLDSTSTNKLFTHTVRKPNIQWLFSKVTTSVEAKEIAAAVTSASTASRPRTDKNDDVDGEEEVEAVLVFNRRVAEMEQRCGMNRYGEGLKKAKTGAANVKPASPTAASAASAVEWTEDDMSRLQKATAKYPPGTVERWTKICEVLRGRFTEDQAMSKVNELTAALRDAGAGNPTVASVSSASTAVGGVPPSSAAAAAAAAASSVEEWSMKQQKQLEQGLRDLKDYKEKDKFQKIAQGVDGKTAKECFDRFKFLVSVNKKKP